MRTPLLFSLLIAVHASAQTGDVERFLVPIHIGGPGAFGSQWVSELRIMNAGTTPASIDNLTDFSEVEPILPPILLPQASMNASQAIRDVPGGTGIQGALLLAHKAVASQFAFNCASVIFLERWSDGEFQFR